ncbi:hypothetical protein ACS0TY_026869 [Phlomoides rotata]
MLGKDWINSYLEGILDVDTALTIRNRLCYYGSEVDSAPPYTLSIMSSPASMRPISTAFGFTNCGLKIATLENRFKHNLRNMMASNFTTIMGRFQGIMNLDF